MRPTMAHARAVLSAEGRHIRHKGGMSKLINGDDFPIWFSNWLSVRVLVAECVSKRRMLRIFNEIRCRWHLTRD